MKKGKIAKISILIVLIIGILGMLNVNTVFADGENYVVELNGAKYESFDSALTALKNSEQATNTLKLLSDVDDTNATGTYQFKANQNVTIDLNGHNLSTAKDFVLFRTQLSIIGTGTVNLSSSMPICICGSNSTSVASDETLLDVGENVTLHSTYHNNENPWAYMISMPYSSLKEYVNGVTVNFNGKITAEEDVKLVGFYVNGILNTGAVFNLGEKSVVTGEDAIYAAGGATWNLSGEINGVTSGIEIRAGNLNVLGGKITATYIPTEVEANGNGGTTKGAAIAIAQHTTKMPINVSINEGTFTAFTPLNEANPQNNSAEDIAKVNVSIVGGKFVNLGSSNPAPVNSVYSQDKTKFITGGEFDIKPNDEYLADGYSTYNKDGKYIVAPVSDFSHNEKTMVKVGETIDLNVIANATELQEFIEVRDVSNEESIIKLEGQKVTGLKPGTGLVNISLGNKGKVVEIYVYDVETNTTDSYKGNETSEMLSEAIANGLDQSSLGLTEEEIDKIVDAVKEGKAITTEVTSEELTEEDIIEESQSIKEVLPEGAQIAGFFNIIVNVNADGEKIAMLRDLNKNIEISIKLPEDMVDVEEGYTRTFCVIRVHDGVSEVVAKDLKDKNGVLLFGTDKFSTYAVAYIDTKDENEVVETSDKNDEAKDNKTAVDDIKNKITNPTTGDKIGMSCVVLVIASVGLIMLRNRRKYHSKH